MVAIDTTPTAPASREQSLRQWIKRTQETLAYRSIQGRKFNRLFNLLRTKRLVEIALDNVLANAGAKTAGVDGVTRKELADAQSRTSLIEEINRELCSKTYKSRPVRRVYIPKANGDQRPLGIPTIKDRVVQEMLRLILEPIYEAQFYAHSYGFRPFRSTHHAAVRLRDLIGRRGYTVAVEGDIRKCFDRIHHLKLLDILRKTIRDERIVKLIGDMLTAGVMEDGAWHATDEGTPQGGIISPLLANIYLNELDQYIAAKWDRVRPSDRLRRQKHKTALPCYIVRYADDFVILVKGTQEQGEQLKAEVAAFLTQELHLELSAEKTLVTDVSAGFDFLGFTIRKYPRATLITPSRKALEKFRAKVKTKVWEGFCVDDTFGVIHLNRFLIGWGMYYRRVSSKRAFSAADNYVWWRVFRTTHRLRGLQLRASRHYKAHYIPYRYDIRPHNRRHKGKNYGVWADAARTKAHIVTQLSFLPIRYVRLHPQLNPYVPEERQELEKKVGVLDPPPDQLPGPLYNPDYGPEWATIRREILQAAGYRCQMCDRPIKNREAQVHHRTKLKGSKRQQANLLENLVALCPTCHSKVERGLPE